jgi:hypothetical protein
MATDKNDTFLSVSIASPEVRQRLASSVPVSAKILDSNVSLSAKPRGDLVVSEISVLTGNLGVPKLWHSVALG